jgi:hypothetical protein
MPLLNPPLPELSHTDVNLYFDPEELTGSYGAYLIEIIFKPGIKLISELPAEIYDPNGISNLMSNFEIITRNASPSFQEPPKIIMLGVSYKPDSLNPPQDQILMIDFREMGSDQLIDSKTKVVFYLSAKRKPKRINYQDSRPAG